MFHDLIVTIPAWLMATGTVTLFLIAIMFMVFGALALWALFQLEDK